MRPCVKDMVGGNPTLIEEGVIQWGLLGRRTTERIRDSFSGVERDTPERRHSQLRTLLVLSHQGVNLANALGEIDVALFTQWINAHLRDDT